MEYQSRRVRRLRAEKKARQRRMRRQKRLLVSGALLATVALIAVSAWFIGGTITQKIATDKLNSAQKQKEPPPTAAENITRELASEIATLEQSLGLPGRLDAGLLPDGAQVAVTMIDLSDRNRGEVHYNDKTQWTAASTYKLFVALEMSRMVESGRLTWNSSLNETTLSNCLYRMIHNSDNSCPETWIPRYSSFAQMNTTARDLGMVSTEFANDNMRTSAGDLGILLRQLYQGKLMDADDRQNLLNLMENQQYRAGIPAGIAQSNQGAIVADKVGFINDYNGPVLNDAGIVLSPKGDYVLVITTNGYSWSFIAQLSAWIDGRMSV
jgi:beta-lactamase class A